MDNARMGDIALTAIKQDLCYEGLRGTADRTIQNLVSGGMDRKEALDFMTAAFRELLEEQFPEKKPKKEEGTAAGTKPHAPPPLVDPLPQQYSPLVRLIEMFLPILKDPSAEFPTNEDLASTMSELEAQITASTRTIMKELFRQAIHAHIPVASASSAVNPDHN